MDRREMLRIIRDVLTRLETEPQAGCLWWDNVTCTDAVVKYGSPCTDTPVMKYGVPYCSTDVVARYAAPCSDMVARYAVVCPDTP